MTGTGTLWVIDQPFVPVPTGEDPMRGYRAESWRIEAFRTDGSPLGPLDGCQDVSLSWQKRSIQGTGTLSWAGTSTPDWISMRLQPWYRADFPDGTSAEWPLGVFIPSTPDESWDDGQVTQSVDLYDKLHLLTEDQLDEAYEVASGVVATTAARAVLAAAGVTSGEIAITESTATLASFMVWPAGTPRLQVVNDILKAINYFELYADGQGVFTASPYVAPLDRPLSWEFKDTRDGVYEPEFSRLKDAFRVPNRVVCVGRSEGGFEGLRSEASNTDPLSPFSIPSRGTTITATFTDIDADSQATLDAIAARKLLEATQVASAVNLKHWLVPLAMDDAVAFRNQPAGIEFMAVVEATSVKLSVEGFADASSDIKEIVL